MIVGVMRIKAQYIDGLSKAVSASGFGIGVIQLPIFEGKNE